MLINMRKLYFASAFILLGVFAIAPFAFAADTTAPKITDLKMSAVDIYGSVPGVSFSWKTNEKTNGKIEYGTISGSYASSAPETYTGFLKHSVAVTGLAYDTAYFFRVQVTDLSGNIANSNEFTYKTPVQNLEIASVRILDVNADSAIIQVSLNRKGVIFITAKNEAGETVGNSYYLNGEEAYTDKGAILLKGLAPDTSYTISVGASYEVYNPGDPDTYPYDSITAIPATKSLTTASVPEITKVTKSKGAVGSIIAIHGKNFGKDLDLSSQKLIAAIGCPVDSDGATSCAAEIIVWTDSEIQLRVTEKSQSGTIYLLNAYGYDDYLVNRGAISFLETNYFPNVAFPGPDLSDKENAMLKFSVVGISSGTAVSKAYGCGFSATARKATSRYAKNIRIGKSFKQGDKTDAYLKSVYDLYKTNWKRAPRCEELQFHYDHKTPLQRLTAWLKGRKPKN